MHSTPADYGWFEERFPELAETFCLTCVRGLEPSVVLERLGAEPEGELVGVAALDHHTWQMWDRHKGGRQLVGATAVDGWTLAIEVNGLLGVTEEGSVVVSSPE